MTLSWTCPTEDDLYGVFQLTYARVPERRVHENFLRRDMHDGPMPLDFNLWIVRNAHRTLLVDTGFGPRTAAERHRPLDMDPIEALTTIGVDPKTIDDVILTHLHYDHAGNLDRFGRARFHVQDSEAAFATGRCMCHAHIRMPYDVEDVVTFVRHTFGERVRFHDGESHPFPGISLHHLPGHSRGLQAVRVATCRGPVLLASDASHAYANFLAHSPFALTIDAAETLASYEAMMRLGGSVEHIIPGHDPLVRDFYPQISVNGVTLHALHVAPKPHDIEAITRICTR